MAFYRIKKIRYKDTVYYYLYREWYDAEEKKKRSRLIGRCDEIEKIVEAIKSSENQWCGGWDLNPRRPTPAGLEQAEKVAGSRKAVASPYPSQRASKEAAISGKSDVDKNCIVLSDSLIREFADWLRLEENTSEKTIRDYLRYLKRALGLRLCSKEDVGKFFSLAGMNKRSYESIRRLLSFVEKKKTGFEELVNQLRKALPRKPRSQADTYVPPDEDVLKLRENIMRIGEPYYTIYRVLVSTGCRLSEAVALLKSFSKERLVKVSEDVYRYHMDLQRKSKNVLVLYLPREVVESISRLDKHVPHPDNIAKAFEKSGLAAKYIRKWFRQTLKKLKVDSEIIEFLQGRVSALSIGAKHYTDFIPLCDEVYTKTVYPHIKSFL